MNSSKPIPDSVKPADALGTLARRTRASRTGTVIVAVAGVIAVAVILGLIWRTVSGGIHNAPTIPKVGVY